MVGRYRKDDGQTWMAVQWPVINDDAGGWGEHTGKYRKMVVAGCESTAEGGLRRCMNKCAGDEGWIWMEVQRLAMNEESTGRG